MSRSLRQSRYGGRRLRTATSRYGARYDEMLLPVVALALLASVQGRAVNISNTWVLPEEGFPVFYRYFRDRISWYEADAVCQFHHANLVTVDTTAQYDAVRAYLKELDISSAVWVGLIRSNPDGDFTWTDYRGLSGEGYWSSAPDARSAPLCAAADPAADYRWEARTCGGPTVASFICELPVPQWALGNEGCMVRALPALTILYLPESAAVQLTADCGMAGVKKVQCTGNVKRDDLLKQLSCADEEELSTVNYGSTGSSWSVTSDSTATDQDTTNEVTTEEPLTTEHEIDINQPRDIPATPVPNFVYSQTQFKTPTKIDKINRLNSILQNKNINLGETQDNNLHSNLVPKTPDEDNILTSDQLEKLEDERHKQHKMLHEEIARVGNVDNIFTQPTDHFIPPLVMAKAKISDDMTVLSLAEKHAQQLAEKHFSKQHLENDAIDSQPNKADISSKTITEEVEKPLILNIKPTKWKEGKKEILKNHSPKKYLNEKYNDVKTKSSRLTDSKSVDLFKKNMAQTFSLSTTTTAKETITTTEKTYSPDIKKSDVGDDFGIDLTVILNDSPLTSEEQPNFTGDVPKLETIQNKKLNETYQSTQTTKEATENNLDVTTTAESKITDNMVTKHEVIKITLISNDDPLSNTTVFDVTTKMPLFKDTDLNVTATPFTTEHIKKVEKTEIPTTANPDNITTIIIENGSTTVPVARFSGTTNSITTIAVTENVSVVQTTFSSTETKSSTEIVSTIAPIQILNQTHHTFNDMNIPMTTALPIAVVQMDIDTNMSNITTDFNETIEKTDANSAEYHEMLMNVTDHRQSEEEDTTDGDFQSPLLSGVMEPMHRPPRTRRPQQPNRNKFNPFRILG